MRCWIIDDAQGFWLSAKGVVFANDENEARVLFDAKLAEAGLPAGAHRPQMSHVYALREIPLEGAHLIDNGDY